MVSLFRLHTAKCTKGHSRGNRAGLNCNCMIHAEGGLESGEYIRKSTATRSMTKARRLVVAAEERGSWDRKLGNHSRSPSLSGHISRFMDEIRDPRGKNLSLPTRSKYQTILRRLEAFADSRGLTSLDDITYEHLYAFKLEWKTGPQATVNNIARLRSFWKHAVKQGWAKRNTALDLDLPLNYAAAEREPYTEPEMEMILAAARSIKMDVQQAVSNHVLETFILVMRYSGLSIADAALLQSKELRGDEVRLFRKKTMRHANKKLVVVPIPLWLVGRLNSLPLRKGRYFFCYDSEELARATEPWHSRLAKVFVSSGVTKGSPHRLRHTFACDLLERHVPIELVSRYLGHQSIAVTQKYYSHYLESRIQADSNVLRKLYSQQKPGSEG